MPKLLTRLRIDEISAVDKGAGEGVRIMLVKRDEDEVKQFGEQPYWKRDFSAKERKAAAASGAAMPDGSFPIHNEEDLQNAMRLAGKAKNPKAARAHIKERAESLGLSSALSDRYKSETKPMSAMEKLFEKYFGGSAPSADEAIEKASTSLAASVGSIIADDSVTDKGGMLTKSFAQFTEHLKELSKDLTKALPVRSTTKEDEMSPAVLKALGLDEKASEEDVLKALAARDEEVKLLKAKKDGMKDGMKDGEDGEDEPEDKRQKAAIAALPESVRKTLEKADVLEKEVAIMKAERELVGFTKQAVEIGLSESEGVTLQKAYAGDKEAITKLGGFIKMGIAAAKAGSVFKEFGGNGAGSPATPYDEIVAKAAELRKKQPELSEHQAFAKVYEDPANREIAKRERMENRPVA